MTPTWRELVLVAALVTMATGCSSSGDETTIPAPWHLADPAGPTDTVLQLVVLGGGCHADDERVGELVVTETADRVGIVAHITKPETTTADCPAVGTAHPATVELADPLGDRLLVGCDVGRPVQVPAPGCDVVG